MKKNFVRISSIILAIVTVCGCVLAFAACDGVMPKSFKEDTRFTIDNSVTNFMGIVKDSVNENGEQEDGLLSLIENVVLNMDETYFEFRSDGTLHAQIQTADGLFGNLTDILSMLGDGFNVEEMLENFDITTGLNYYVEPMFPGFTERLEAADLKGALELIQHSLGFNIEGLDWEDEGVKEALQYVATEKKLPSNLLDLIPADTVLKLTLDTEYAIKYFKSADNKRYTAIYLGYDVKNNPTTEPFGVFTMTEEDGVKKLFLRLEFMDINIGLKTM